ncbi:hypothetical protein SPRG_20156 [Saprolegnia parasitica CBS 223.65]|uniref:Uncharacterized protein n=1 Tax=Saprolegnia parasitica (strain CBS 223.65) TaxID=695850 RepID=A0A067CCW9_SAPPC|nr:hypothetical protein SPRG_20156 [Saprolegnia parasitica CBS 223.65]KDO28333.1 hypothetical protein SPRG_20156 [Saprolegnia parasitica CBS 223.65]|eukprot:XP_012200954.1 hypothetical protein SPRG_20156 [Saprolegnia parasitica CBS 223.65]
MESASSSLRTAPARLPRWARSRSSPSCASSFTTDRRVQRCSTNSPSKCATSASDATPSCARPIFQ